MSPRKLDKTRLLSPDDLIYTATIGDNSEVFSDIVGLYLKEGQTIADPTYGKGRFWTKIDKTKYNGLYSDLKVGLDCKGGIDCRNLPYEKDSIDALVIDIPYRAHHKGRAIKGFDEGYNLDNSGLYLNSDVLNLYEGGMREAYRVLKLKGFLILKCQDMIESSKQHWNHITLYQKALEIGFSAEDLLVVVNNKKLLVTSYTQVHARKNHSYFWVFKKVM